MIEIVQHIAEFLPTGDQLTLFAVNRQFLHGMSRKQVLVPLLDTLLQDIEKNFLQASEPEPIKYPRKKRVSADFMEDRRYLCQNTSLPSFFYSAISEHTLTPPYVLEIKRKYHGEEDHFVTGGYVCQKLYNKKWKGDVDIWSNKALQMNDDNVIVDYPPQNCISFFDFSCVQQGFLYERGNCTHYFTLLSLYSYYTGKVITNFSNHAFSYRIRQDNYLKRIVDYYIQEQTYNEQNIFTGKENPRTYDEGPEPIKTWIGRLRKYQRRFPSRFSYTLRI